jgi:hypothetical protein
MAKEIRVLLVAPDTAKKLNNRTEINQLTSLEHVRVRVLAGHVTAQTLFEATKDQRWDIIHFAVDSGPDSVALNGDILSATDLRMIATNSRVRCLFFNSCRSGKLASALIQRGVQHAISLNIDLEDAGAWKMPLYFYEFLNEQIRLYGSYNIPDAFFSAVPGDGTYNLTSAQHTISAANIQQDVQRLRGWIRWIWLILAINTVGWATVEAWQIWGQ